MSVYNQYLCEMEECSDAAGMYYEQVQFGVCVCVCTVTEQAICDTEGCLLLTGTMLLYLIKNNFVVQMQGDIKNSCDLL